MDKTIVEKCIDWNAARYDCIYDMNLSMNLLLEETAELFEAKDEIAKLDAIGDITFVAIGVMWKLKIPISVITVMFENLDSMEPNEAIEHCFHLLNLFQENNTFTGPSAMNGLHLACQSIFVIALSALRGMGMQKDFYKVVHAICDSNNTKEIKGKTDPSIKANIVKGSNYVPPTAVLIDIFAYRSRS